jgi:alpha-L-fucosidase
MDLPKASTVKYIVLQEYIKLGQRVQSFTVEAWKDNAWQKVAEGTTIGYKRILRIEPVKTSRIRVNITGSKACPVISNAEIY